MKKLLTLAGVVATLALFHAYAGGIANPESLNARAAVLDAGQGPSADATATACPKGMTCPKGMDCPKGTTCPKGAKASSSCPMPKDGATTCPVTGATGKTRKPASSEKAVDKNVK